MTTGDWIIIGVLFGGTFTMGYKVGFWRGWNMRDRLTIGKRWKDD